MEGYRARNTKVCMQCHARKARCTPQFAGRELLTGMDQVKCDLQDRADGTCKNCQRANVLCR
jgi:hypothetical protein